MMSCCQPKGQTILEHGEAVAARYQDLIGEQKMEWRLPDWFDLELLLPFCPPAKTMEQYHIYHDCAKGDVRVLDTDGKQHFPNHAMVSAALWLSHGGDHLIGKLIEHDMDFHVMKVSDVNEYKHMDLAPALLLTALCELHANAEMFGGIESTSFKIKWKNLNKLGRNIITHIKGN